MKSVLVVLECYLLRWAYPESHDAHSLSIAVNASSLVHIVHIVLLLPIEKYGVKYIIYNLIYMADIYNLLECSNSTAEMKTLF